MHNAVLPPHGKTARHGAVGRSAADRGTYTAHKRRRHTCRSNNAPARRRGVNTRVKSAGLRRPDLTASDCWLPIMHRCTVYCIDVINVQKIIVNVNKRLY